MTVHVPLRVLPQLRPDGFDWLVPALRVELVTTLHAQRCPRTCAAALVPVPRPPPRVLAALEPRREPLLDALAASSSASAACAFRRSAFDLGAAAAPPADDASASRTTTGDALAEGKRPRTRCARSVRRGCVRSSRARRPRSSATGCGRGRSATLPREIALPGTGEAVRAYPALVDEGDDGRRAARSRRAAAQAAAM